MNADTIISLIIIAAIVYFVKRRTKNIDKKYNDYDSHNKQQYHKPTYKSNTQKEIDIIRQNYIQTSMLTPTEQIFYNQLKEALKHYDIEIHYKVRLADIFKVKYHNRYYDTNFAKIMAKHIDFIIANKQEAKAIIAVELDDPSHDKEESFKNDNFKNILFENSNIKLQRIKVQTIYDFTELKHMLKEYLNVSSVLNKESTSKVEKVEKKIQENEITNIFKNEPEPEKIYK